MLNNNIVEITSLSHEGRGIAHLEGKTLFLEGGLPGEQVAFEYIRKHRHFDEGRVIEVVHASPDRVVAFCPHFGVCGGCSQQYMSPALQIQHKQTVLLENLLHIGKVEPKTILSPLLGPPRHYRHKARLGVKFVEKKQKLLIGFHEKKGRFLADLSRCDILHPAIGQQFESLRALLMSLGNYRCIPQIEVAVGDECVAIVIRHLENFSENDLQKLKNFSKEKNIKIYLQAAGPDSVRLLDEEEAKDLFYCLPEFDLKLFFKPLDFTQINPVINRQLVLRAVQLLDIQSHDRVIDFFCGLGNFTLPLARLAQSVVGVEGSAEMIARARFNAEKNQVSNIEFFVENLMALPQEVSWKRNYNKVLLDPPRVGAVELLTSMSLQAERLVYVSCNPATLARDAGYLVSQGYSLESAGIVDMFPQTGHVESIAVFKGRL